MTMAKECQFDLKPLHCSNCGAFIGDLGTCEDQALCGPCAKEMFGNNIPVKGDQIWQRDFSDEDGLTYMPTHAGNR